LGFGVTTLVMDAGGTVDPAQLEKIKNGMTESQVKAILGEPSKVEDKTKHILGGKQLFEFRVLSYGPEGGADLIFLRKKSGEVYKVVPH
jgi:hypothetical protein